MKALKKNPIRKKRGRPATGQDPVTAIRLSADIRAAVDTWADNQRDGPTRSEAIRRLVEIALAADGKSAPSQRVHAARADRAKELAAKMTEKIVDPSAPLREQTKRRRQLTRGPSEFRDVRIDQPKDKGK